MKIALCGILAAGTLLATPVAAEAGEADSLFQSFLDDFPVVAGASRFSKDRLLEIGVSFFN